MDTLPDIGRPPSFGFTETMEASVDRVSFGDGYEQRRPAGINSVKRAWSPEWSPLTVAQKDTMYDFLLSKKSVEAFLFTPKTHGAAVRVVATGVTWTQQGRFYSVSAVFTEDFGL